MEKLRKVRRLVARFEKLVRAVEDYTIGTLIAVARTRTTGEES